ncbi:MAG TPA: hypothetical protein DC047_19975 [Blastocatellia bacterium]|nr:hypothetical protein [Blastocatellia bacterium]
MFVPSGDQLRLINSLGNDDSPVWCRDGTKLLFRSDRERESSKKYRRLPSLF